MPKVETDSMRILDERATGEGGKYTSDHARASHLVFTIFLIGVPFGCFAEGCAVVYSNRTILYCMYYSLQLRPFSFGTHIAVVLIRTL